MTRAANSIKAALGRFAYLYVGCLLRLIRYGEYASTTKAYGFQSIGQDCVIGRPVYLECPHKIRIGKRVSMAGCVYIGAPEGAAVEIGDDTMIAAFAIISTATHDYHAKEMRRTGINRSVVIGKGCWIGLNAIILPGVTIGDGAVVGAGAVVTKDVEPGAIVVGVPARLMKYRESEMLR